MSQFYKSSSACVVLINPEGLVLGVSRKDDHTDFGLIGGGMEDVDNGNPMATAIRETLEETGLKISNLRLVFATHKNGNMGYTYLADYEGEINHNEPHIVKWVSFQHLINGRFGKYNKLVSESLTDMGVNYLYENKSEISQLTEEVKKYVNDYFKNTDITFDYLEKDYDYDGKMYFNVYLTYNDNSDDYDDYLEESISVSKKFDNDLITIGKKYSFYVRLSSDYLSK